MRPFFFILTVFFLSACSLLPPLPTEPASFITVQPSSTPSPLPSSTATPATPTLSPTPTADPNYVRDDFDGSLESQWSWIREDSRYWSLIALPGSLQITVNRGHVAAHNNSNLLLRPAPQGNFLIQTQLTFRPVSNFQFAGLIIYENDSNFIQAGRGYCNSVDCVGPGLYMNYYKKGVVVKPDFGQTYREIDPILLRLTRQENNYTFEASTDGKVWFLVGSHTSDINPAHVGLVTGQRIRGDSLPATFEYFEVRSLP